MEGSCYHFSSGASLNWTAAKSACEDLGSNLVVINSQAEQQAIAAKVSQRTWIGLYRNPKNKSLWLWVDGSPVTYTNWAKGEPNSPNSEKCGEMYPKERGWKWNDKECYAKFPFVCEKRVVCPKNWIYMEGSCYHFSSGASLNWTAAKSACEDLGSNLVVINSQAEQQAIAAKVSQRTWIGLYRNPKNKSLWLWVDGSPVTYTNWNRGEPNDHPNSEKCAEMYPSGKWNDKKCYAKFSFVCEKRVMSVCEDGKDSYIHRPPRRCIRFR
ncbi:hypothetical protein ACROYT_G008992 [Oculina patagonica]